MRENDLPDFPSDTKENNTPKLSPTAVNVMTTVGGVVEVTIGISCLIDTCGTGAALGCAVLTAHGADGVRTGINGLLTGEIHPTATFKALSPLVGETAARAVDAAIPLVAGGIPYAIKKNDMNVVIDPKRTSEIAKAIRARTLKSGKKDNLSQYEDIHNIDKAMADVAYKSRGAAFAQHALGAGALSAARIVHDGSALSFSNDDTFNKSNGYLSESFLKEIYPTVTQGKSEPSKLDRNVTNGLTAANTAHLAQSVKLGSAAADYATLTAHGGVKSCLTPKIESTLLATKQGEDEDAESAATHLGSFLQSGKSKILFAPNISLFSQDQGRNQDAKKTAIHPDSFSQLCEPKNFFVSNTSSLFQSKWDRNDPNCYLGENFFKNMSPTGR